MTPPAGASLRGRPLQRIANKRRKRSAHVAGPEVAREQVQRGLLDPLHLKKEKVNFILEGVDLAQLYPIIGVPFPPTPPYRLTGRLDHTGDIWTFKQFEGKVGDSDLSGDLSVDLGKTPQLITADLRSGSLEIKDLSGFIGADLVSGPRNKVLPTKPFSLEKIRAADADVLIRGEKIITKTLSIEEMDAHLIIKGGTLKLAPDASRLVENRPALRLGGHPRAGASGQAPAGARAQRLRAAPQASEYASQPATQHTGVKEWE